MSILDKVDREVSGPAVPAEALGFDHRESGQRSPEEDGDPIGIGVCRLIDRAMSAPEPKSQ